eukprot:gene16247-16426_t
MAGESYIGTLRRKVGQDLLLCPSVAAVILDEDGKLLLQEKRSGEAWSLPAGGIELGETPQEAIRREGFRYTYPGGDQVEYVITLFRCRIIDGDGIPGDGETRRTCYFTREQCPPLALPYPENALFAEPKI